MAKIVKTSEKFDTVKYYYDNGFWAIDRVRQAVVKGWITEGEFKTIIGEDY